MIVTHEKRMGRKVLCWSAIGKCLGKVRQAGLGLLEARAFFDRLQFTEFFIYFSHRYMSEARTFSHTV